MRVLLFFIGLIFTIQAHAREVTDLREFGDISASTMYLFASPTCPHCRDFHKSIFPELIKRYVRTKKAQIVIVDMAYDENAMQATMVMRCLSKSKSEKMMGWLYENQQQWLNSKDPKATIKQYANILGMSAVDFRKCLADTHLKDTVEQQRDTISRLYGVRGWPTIALRQGNTVRLYSGTDKYSILQGLDADIKLFENEMKERRLKGK